MTKYREGTLKEEEQKQECDKVNEAVYRVDGIKEGWMEGSRDREK